MTPLVYSMLTLAALAPGARAPDFTATDIDGTPHVLTAMLERGPVVLAFFPMAFTPG